MLSEIEKVVDAEIRPKLREHGGDIELISLEDGVLRYRMLGQCAGCPAADETAEEIIETALREKFPEIRTFSMETGVSDSLMELARRLMEHER